MSDFSADPRLMAALGVQSLSPERAEEVDLGIVAGALESGDHIAVVKYKEEHWHHGIYLGQVAGAASVMDFWGPDKGSAQISVRPLRDFLVGAQLVAKVQYGVADGPLNRTLTVLVAHLVAQLYPHGRGGISNAAFNNCECFATFCKIGRWVAVVLLAELCLFLDTALPCRQMFFLRWESGQVEQLLAAAAPHVHEAFESITGMLKCMCAASANKIGK